MAELTPSQTRIREQTERLIGLMVPALDLILAAGDRISRIVAPEDFEYYPERPLEKRQPAARPSAGSPPDGGPG